MPPKGKATHFSSAKAAEALAARGGGGFGGFSGSAPAGASTGFAFGSKYVGQVAAAVPGAAAAAGDGSGARAAAAIIPADLDGELAQQLQKLSKRDATTKLKALQALRALAKDKPASDLQAALPSWAYLFGRLVMDGSRAVRAEACHVTAALAAAVGRGIAPLLKSLLPPLWLAQFDAYGEAAAAARGAFAAAFPAAAKQREALLFCRAEVLQLLSDNLASTPQSLGDAKKESVEELADRHERVLAASCGALAALLDLAAGQAGAAGTAAAGTEAAEPPAAEQEVLAGIQAEFELPPFYKAVMQSKAAPVRRAAYSLVAAAAERRPQLLAGSLAVGAAAVLGALGDKDPANHEAMWGMLLAYARAAPDSWRHVNMQKAFLPRLWAFLRHGCYGSAAASYPALLPLGSLLPPDVLGPHPGFFVSLLEAIWQGLPTLAGPGGGPAARQAAAAAFQDCLLYALLKSDQLAAMGGSAAAAAAPPAQQAQQGYCAEVLQAAVGGLLMPALTSAAAAPEAASAAEAQAVLAGAVGRLSSPSASVSSRERLDQLLQVLGASLAAAMQQALGSAAAEQQPEADSAAASAASSSELCERASALVTAVEQAAGPSGHAALGAAVAQPLVALLLPEVRSGSAPPAASSLLAALLKSFPQHAAADVARPESPSAAAAAAAATAAVPTDEMAALRLHQSASFTIESIVRRLGEEQQPEAAAANCDLLLSCLPQVHHPARKLADVLQQLLPQQAGGATSPAALLLLQRLVSGQHAELATAACRSAELDRAAAALSSSGSWLGGSDELTPQVLSLLLVGDGSTSLLSEAAQAALLGQLLQQLQAAGEAAAEASTSMAEAAPAAAPVMQVVQSAVLSPALDASGSAEVRSLRLRLLAAALGLLLRDTAADAAEAAAEAEAVAAMEANDRDPSTFMDDSDVESVELQQQLGVAAAAARQLWQQAGTIAQLVQQAPAEQQATFAASLQQEVQGTLEQHATPAAAAGAAEVAAQLLLPALGSSSIPQQLLQGLLKQQQPDDAAAGSSSAAAAAGLDAPLALFLAATAAAAGFEELLLPSGPQEAAQSAVSILAALEPVSSAVASEPSRQLRQHVAVSAGATLLQPALATAATAAAASGRHAAVVAALLRQAVGSGSSVALQAAAGWFAAASAEQQLGSELLLKLLPIVAPACRSSEDLLQQSQLAELSQRLCQQCCATEPAALASSDGQSTSLQLLQAAVACFPCSTGADAAAQLPSPAAAAAAAQQQAGAAARSSFSKGDAVWYRQQDGSWAEAEVAAVDLTVHPPSYSVRFTSSPEAALRETEASRLQPRQSDQPAPPSTAQQAASAAAAAAAAAEQRAAAGAALAPVGCCTPEEQAALLQLLQHQVRGTRAAAAAARAEGTAACAGPAPAVAAAVGALLHSCMAYCGQQLNQQQWSLVLEQLRTTLAACAASLAAAAARVAAAVCAAAAEVAVGADMGSPAVALQFFRRLKLKGVLERSAKARAEAGRVATTLAAELSDLDDQLLPQLLPSLQAYTRAAAVAGSSRSVAERDWQAAEAAVCGDALQLFVTAGSMAAAAAVCGDEAAAVLSDWMAGPLGAAQEEAGTEQGPAVWQLLSQVVATTLRGADRAFLLAAVDRANGGMDATGVDALGSLLALSLSGIPPASMAGAAFAAILQHPELTAALTAAEGVDEEALEEQQQQAAGGAASDSGDAAATLEQVGVRPELAAAVAGSPGSSGFYTGWSLLMAHVLAAPADSHGRRLLVQSVKEAHALVPALMDALVPLLPLDIGSGGRRRDSGGSAAGGGMPGGAAAAVSAAAGSRTSSGSSSGSAASAFASQLAELGPYPSGHSDDLAALSLAQQQHAQRFAVLLYAAVLQALPASARLWFADLRDRGTAAATERYTSGAVSGQLLAAELAAVTEAASTFGKFDKFSVRANATSREVIAVMEVEDGHMLELAVKLPAALPLRPPELECRRKVGVSEGRLRKWLLSISAFLRTQNGSVAEAISLWKRNVDKEFEGQEECLICYSIIQPTSGQLPRLGCRTCRKRFHGGCLYKWFKSSGKSNCPHCQSPW